MPSDNAGYHLDLSRQLLRASQLKGDGKKAGVRQRAEADDPAAGQKEAEDTPAASPPADADDPAPAAASPLDVFKGMTAKQRNRAFDTALKTCKSMKTAALAILTAEECDLDSIALEDDEDGEHVLRQMYSASPEELFALLCTHEPDAVAGVVA